jgi:phage terminase small subunit
MKSSSKTALVESVSHPGRNPLKDMRHEIFCREYTRHGDKQRAVVAAGFNCKTWAEGSTSASAMGCGLLKKEHVLARVQYLQEKRWRQADLDEINVLKELKRIAFFDLAALYHENGALRPVTEWPAEARRAIAAVDVEKLFSQKDHVGYTVKVKTHNKVAALEKLMQYFHMIDAPQENKGLTVNAQNAQVNFYLPENPRHAKTVNAVAREDARQEEAPSGIALPPKRLTS